MLPHLIIIDGNAFVHRAFHIRKEWIIDGGMNVNAVVGFTEMLWKIQRRALERHIERHATHLVVVFDSGTPNHRHRLYPAYKANRKEKSPELAAQFPLIHRATAAFGAYHVVMDGYEADDIIATIAADRARQGEDVTIISSDKDLMQLIGGLIHVYDPMAERPGDPEFRKGRTITADLVFEKFGVWPSEIGDYLAIVGDTVDNVPGVEGIGAKGAAALLGAYGSIDGIYEHIAEIKPPRRQQMLVASEDKLRLSRKLVALDHEVPVPFEIDRAEIVMPRKLPVLAFLREMGLRRMAEGVVAYINRNRAPLA